MSGITGAMNTALSGLQLFEAGISTVSNNLANQSVPGYAAETVNANTATTAAGLPGTGVTAPQIVRAASGFAASLLRSANSASQAASNQASALTTLSNALANNGNVQSSVNQFFLDVSTLAANPTSTAQRQTALSDAQSVASSFSSAAGVMNGTLSNATQTLTQSVASANNLLGQLAQINKSLVSSPNNPSLLDQQQGALNALSSLLSVNTLPQPNGSVIVAAGGTMLLDQSGTQTLNVVPGSGTTAPGVTAGTNAIPVSAGASDGAIGSSITSYQAGSTALQGLNALATVFAISVNNTQAQGLTPSGTQGSALFSVPNPSVLANTTNTGGATVTAQITNPSALPTNGGPFTLAYSATAGWSATNQASGQSYTSTTTPPSFAGMTLGITGTPANGDSFVLNPAPNAATGIAVTATDPNAIAAADPYVATAGTLQSGGSILNSNGGSITSGTDTVTATPASNAAVIPSSYFGQNLQLTFTSATAYTVSTSASPGTAIASGTLGSNGGNVAVAYPSGGASGMYWQLPITGAPASGDTLTLTPGGSNSGSNAARMATLWTASGATADGTLQQSIVGFSTALGSNAQAAQQLSAAAATQVTSATSNLQTVSGVSSDKQAIMLTNYQQAYQAAAQVISIAHTMFESLLTAV
ncbi:MAG: flagellar biosynthesis protein FlgK [Acidocella sp. 20-63-7]|nr:MAG: flagellar biosynthesis protein FlgK [Acidocella sp. 20-63-7]HQT45959.1 flagellar basal body protein [Acidocella sp.]